MEEYREPSGIDGIFLLEAQRIIGRNSFAPTRRRKINGITGTIPDPGARKTTEQG